MKRKIRCWTKRKWCFQGTAYVLIACTFAIESVAQSNTFPSSGNVGIGTTSPAAKLEVFGTGSGTPVAVFNNTWASYSDEAEDNRPLVLRRSSSDAESFSTYVQDTALFQFYQNDESSSAMHFRIRSTDTEVGGGANANDWTVLKLIGSQYGPRSIFEGKVGIGTTSPTNALEVNGTIRAKEVIVETSSWPDYVFGKDYKLLPLSEVARHIEVKGHLPGTGKAKEVNASGQSLGETQRLMMQKIEELTLYLIEKDQRLLSLEAKVRELDAKLAAKR